MKRRHPSMGGNNYPPSENLGSPIRPSDIPASKQASIMKMFGKVGGEIKGYDKLHEEGYKEGYDRDLNTYGKHAEQMIHSVATAFQKQDEKIYNTSNTSSFEQPYSHYNQNQAQTIQQNTMQYQQNMVPMQPQNAQAQNIRRDEKDFMSYLEEEKKTEQPVIHDHVTLIQTAQQPLENKLENICNLLAYLIKQNKQIIDKLDSVSTIGDTVRNSINQATMTVLDNIRPLEDYGVSSIDLGDNTEIYATDLDSIYESEYELDINEHRDEVQHEMEMNTFQEKEYIEETVPDIKDKPKINKKKNASKN